MRPASATETMPAYAARAARLQHLYIGLLFGENLRHQWTHDRQTLLDQYRLPRDAGNLLPNIDSKEFRNECTGRRNLIALELYPRFPKTLLSVHGVESVRELEASALLSRFLESRHFLTMEHSLPHPHGIGKSDESCSKFFLWLRDVRFAGQQRLRLALHQDFAAHLIRQSVHCCSEPLVRARNGVLFRAHACSDDDWFLVDKDLQLQPLHARDLPTLLSGHGFFLDQVDETGNYRRLSD